MIQAGCQAPPATIDDEVYVEAMAQLGLIHVRYLNVERADSARQAILEELSLTPDDLVLFAEIHGGDTGKMFRLSEMIRMRADSLEAAAAGVPLGGQAPADSTGSP